MLKLKLAEKKENKDVIKIKPAQKNFPVSAIIAGIVGACIYDEDRDVYIPIPKEYIILAEERLAGTSKTVDVSVTVVAGTTEGTNSAQAPAGNVYYIKSITVSGVSAAGVTGKLYVTVDGTPLFDGGRTLADETIDLSAIFGNHIRGKSIDVRVVLDAAPTADVTLTITADVVQRKDLIK